MIGRVEEKKYLQSLLEEEEPQFVAVFGRRRIGKTYLVRESFDHHFTFQHTGISNLSIKESSRKRAQLDKFEESLAEAGYICPGKLDSWNDAFNALKQVILQSNDTKKVIFIDELSWMDTKDSGLISALESFWNGWATARKEKDIVLIVCASATYWIIDNIVNAHGGLYNRLTGQIHLKPFSLKECELYLQSRKIVLSRHQILQCYMIMGGVPYYWSLLKKGNSLPQNIDDLFFKENAPLQNEYDNLYKALFNHPDQYMRIIEALSTVHNGITRDEISRLTGIPTSGDFSRKLTELENCGFIRKYIPYGYKQRNCLYQLIDNYTLFYFHFVKDQSLDEHEWQNLINTPAITSWSGTAFERVCLEHVPQIKQALGISGVHTETNAWSCKKDEEAGIHGSQIDLLIVRADQIINLCEMKYSSSDYVINSTFIRDMNRKISDFKACTKTRYAIHPLLITTYEVEQNAYAGELQAILTAEDLFS
ncbi:MAG: AAA family ATPase [Solobacterium sp.]|nr:AAA family ATPase [Solobacterium sp.]